MAHRHIHSRPDRNKTGRRNLGVAASNRLRTRPAPRHCSSGGMRDDGPRVWIGSGAILSNAMEKAVELRK